jgi:hypothetical protein
MQLNLPLAEQCRRQTMFAHFVFCFFMSLITSPPASYLLQFFGLVPSASLLALKAAGQHYCEDDWSKLRIEHRNIDDLDLSRYCFSSAFMVALLHDSLGIPMYERRYYFSLDADAILFPFLVVYSI